MLTEAQAKTAFKEAMPNTPIEAVARYRDVYLLRVTYASANERNYDPFFSVDILTGEVRDFSVMNDGDISEIAKLF